jgi:hypothetical protein
MRKLSQRLFMFVVLGILTLTLAVSSSSPVIVPTVEAADDCDALGRVCRQMSEGVYNLCIALGGNASTCAWNEANNTIDCLKAAGCPLHL